MSLTTHTSHSLPNDLVCPASTKPPSPSGNTRDSTSLPAPPYLTPHAGAAGATCPACASGLTGRHTGSVAANNNNNGRTVRALSLISLTSLAPIVPPAADAGGRPRG
ncbi:MAG TPA: hypothetical protein VN228_00485 [Pyrinomonadaceae bacterium]|nr:hypothetical protein [Pyrinomonadaceae bacterium]